MLFAVACQFSRVHADIIFMCLKAVSGISIVGIGNKVMAVIVGRRNKTFLLCVYKTWLILIKFGA